ncbi:MAG: hypothetical protein KA419_02745 [Acidobacteria bacterium]|nr:hypothetical protein [Acidobacteriota bacterium]
MKRALGLMALAVLVAAWAAGGVEYRTRNTVKLNSQTTGATSGNAGLFDLLASRLKPEERELALQSGTLVRAQGGSALVLLVRPRVDDARGISARIARDGNYLLHRGGDRQSYLVDPVRKVYAVYPLSPAEVKEAMKVGGMKLECKASDLAITAESLPDEPLGGGTCRHLRLTVRYVAQYRMSKLMRWQKENHTDVLDVWLRPDLPGYAGVPDVLRTEVYRTMYDEVNTAVWNRLRDLFKDGFPIRQRFRLNAGNPGVAGFNASKFDADVGLDVEDLRAVEIPPSEFELPAGYARVTLDELIRAESPAKP